jgi:hypothetical protein
MVGLLEILPNGYGYNSPKDHVHHLGIFRSLDGQTLMSKCNILEQGRDHGREPLRTIQENCMYHVDKDQEVVYFTTLSPL